MKDPHVYLNFFRKRAHHPDGLIVAIIIYGSAVNLFAGDKLELISKAVIFILGLFTIVMGWLFIRRIPRFESNEIGILFAASAKEDIAEDLDVLYDEVCSLLKQRSLRGLICIKKLPLNIIVNNQEVATFIREKSKCALLIWGRYEKGKIQEREFSGFSSKINFTYLMPDNRLAKQINDDISIAASDRLWLFSTSNELIERDLVTKNIVDVSRYIIGTCLLLFGNLELSKTFLSEIVTSPYGTWSAKARSSVYRFVNNIKLKLSIIDARLAGRIYLENVFVGGVLHDNQNALMAIENYTLLSINNSPNLGAYLLLAISLFLQGQVAKSKIILKKNRKRWPSDPNPDYSLAFLYAYDGDLRKSKAHYKRAFKLTSVKSEADAFHIAEFQEAFLERDPARYHFHFTLGLINLELLDSESAIKHFETFVEIAREQDALVNTLWITEAEKYVRDCSGLQAS